MVNIYLQISITFCNSNKFFQDRRIMHGSRSLVGGNFQRTNHCIWRIQWQEPADEYCWALWPKKKFMETFAGIERTKQWWCYVCAVISLTEYFCLYNTYFHIFYIIRKVPTCLEIKKNIDLLFWFQVHFKVCTCVREGECAQEWVGEWCVGVYACRLQMNAWVNEWVNGVWVCDAKTQPRTFARCIVLRWTFNNRDEALVRF